MTLHLLISIIFSMDGVSFIRTFAFFSLAILMCSNGPNFIRICLTSFVFIFPIFNTCVFDFFSTISTFSQGIGFLIKEKVISVSSFPPQASTVAEEKIPEWIKNNAKWWADGMISEDDFLKGITYMVEKGIVKVQ